MRLVPATPPTELTVSWVASGKRSSGGGLSSGRVRGGLRGTEMVSEFSFIVEKPEALGRGGAGTLPGNPRLSKEISPEEACSCPEPSAGEREPPGG